MPHSKLLNANRWSGAAAFALVAACSGGDETQPDADHTPESYSVTVNDEAVTPPYSLPVGQTVVVRIHFLNADGESLDDVESSHFAGLTFQPAALASAERRADHHFQFNVTAGTPGTGNVTVGFGHSDAADEVMFPPEAVIVPGGGEPGAQ
jgi:hypothetical protein